MTNDEKKKIFEDQVLKAAEALKKCVEETKERLAPVFEAVAKAAAVCKANEIDITENGTQDATKCAEGMTDEEAASYFEELIECADVVDASYTDCVKVEAIRTAFKALKERKPAQDATEAAETHDFREGELIVYVNGETFQIGEIKRLCDDGAFVWYHEGDTASKTPFENMHKLQNEYCIKLTSLAQDRPRCGSCRHFSECSTMIDIEALTDAASRCDEYDMIIRSTEP